jgi:hypothetical protein
MKNGLILIAALLASSPLLGCASMSREECLMADWRTIGYEDGVRGLTGDNIARHRKACAKAGVAPDRAAYELGRQDGLREFCQPARGYDYGRGGNNYAGVCPADLEDEFLQAYSDGRALFSLEQGVRDVEGQLVRTDRQIDRLREDLRAGEAALIDGRGTTEDRANIVEDNRELTRQLGQLELERDQLLIELGERREQLRAYVN